jgi:hypothetical protein
VSHLTGGQAVLPTKTPVEIGKIAKADVIGDAADREFLGVRIAEELMRSGQALADQEIRKRGSVRLEQALQIARRDVQVRCDRSNRYVAPFAVRDDVGLREFQPRGSQSAAPCRLGKTRSIVDGKREQVLQMTDGQIKQLLVEGAFGVQQVARIVCQEVECAGAAPERTMASPSRSERSGPR